MALNGACGIFNSMFIILCFMCLERLYLVCLFTLHLLMWDFRCAQLGKNFFSEFSLSILLFYDFQDVVLHIKFVNKDLIFRDISVLFLC